MSEQKCSLFFALLTSIFLVAEACRTDEEVLEALGRNSDLGKPPNGTNLIFIRLYFISKSYHMIPQLQPKNFCPTFHISEETPVSVGMELLSFHIVPHSSSLKLRANIIRQWKVVDRISQPTFNKFQNTALAFENMDPCNSELEICRKCSALPFL